jgi:hypothetical protein
MSLPQERENSSNKRCSLERFSLDLMDVAILLVENGYVTFRNQKFTSLATSLEEQALVNKLKFPFEELEHKLKTSSGLAQDPLERFDLHSANKIPIEPLRTALLNNGQ